MTIRISLRSQEQSFEAFYYLPAIQSTIHARTQVVRWFLGEFKKNSDGVDSTRSTLQLVGLNDQIETHVGKTAVLATTLGGSEVGCGEGGSRKNSRAMNGLLISKCFIDQRGEVQRSA